VDERKLLVFAGGDTDPGVYYLFDRDKHDLHILSPARPQLEGRALATMKAIRYKTADGTEIPAFLTLPPGKESAKGLPAIVMPHGGPASRDEWGFDWLPQYFAARAYAVLQPNFRGSSGYGDAWFQQNGFKSWRVAIGDVVDAGRWLVTQGIADPKKLGDRRLVLWRLCRAAVGGDRRRTCSRRSSRWRRSPIWPCSRARASAGPTTS
jgi:dipeptidyl aminopeptidase/acylaminoacyl peptidase